jgi:transcriptional regulator with XRE-family HTH domain
MLKRQISIHRLAALSGITVRSIVRYRNGEVVPRDYFGVPTPNAWKLARALGVTIDDLFPPDDNDNDEPNDEPMAA